MQAILDAPVGADFVEQFAGSNFFARQAGKTILGLFLDFSDLKRNEMDVQSACKI